GTHCLDLGASNQNQLVPENLARDDIHQLSRADENCGGGFIGKGGPHFSVRVRGGLLPGGSSLADITQVVRACGGSGKTIVAAEYRSYLGTAPQAQVDRTALSRFQQLQPVVRTDGAFQENRSFEKRHG